jgi:sarcosine oxidase subunit beta
VLVSAGGYSAGLIYHMLGIKLPISVLTIQAMVTQPLKPLLDHVVSSGAYHCYANQTLKGEIATGAHMDQWPNYTTQNTAHYIKHQAEALSDWLPCLRGVKFMRIWGGLADMTPDMAPIMDGNDPIEGFYMDCGWGYFGFKSCSAVGKYMARVHGHRRTVRTCSNHFNLRRYENHRLHGATPQKHELQPGQATGHRIRLRPGSSPDLETGQRHDFQIGKRRSGPQDAAGGKEKRR